MSSTQDAKLSIIYYAGHGIEVDGENYLIPITARLESGADVATQTVPLTSVLQMIANTGGVKVVLVDACRNNPFAERLRSQPGSRRIGTGLSRVDVMRQGEKPGGIMIGYAAREGTFALDGEGRRNSPYAEALLKHIEESSLEIGKLFRNVRDTVFSLTDGYQEPFTYGSLPGEDIYLAAAVAPPPLLAADSDEDTLFEAASNVGTPRVWELYFSRYPRGSRQKEALEIEAITFRQDLQARNAGRDISAARSLDWMRQEAVTYLRLRRTEQLAIQSSLNRLGYAPGAIDGALGPMSFSALANFQRDRGLLADGVLDRATLSALRIRLPKGRNYWFPVAATLGKRYMPETISAIETDPRLHRLVQTFSGQLLNYSYYEERLFAVVRPAGVTQWDQAELVSQSAGGHLATINSAGEEAALVELFRYDSMFWTERKAKDTYDFPGDDGLSVIGPSFGLHQVDGDWIWVDGTTAEYRNWMPGYPQRNRPKPFGEFVHRIRAQNALPGTWRWGNWHTTRNSLLIEIE